MKDGRILQTDTPTGLYNHPNQEFVAGFVGTSNLIGDRFVRPEHLRLMPPGSGGIPVRVTGIQFSGMIYTYSVSDGKREFRIAEMNRGSDSPAWNPGDPGEVLIPGENGEAHA